jgi:hypothetical protein
MIKQIAATVTALLLVGVLVALVGHERTASAPENFDTVALGTELASCTELDSCSSLSSTCDDTKEMLGRGFDISQLLDVKDGSWAGLKAQVAFGTGLTDVDGLKDDEATWSRYSSSDCQDTKVNAQTMTDVATDAATSIGFSLSSLMPSPIGSMLGLSLGFTFNTNTASAFKSSKQISINTCTIKESTWSLQNVAARVPATVENMIKGLAGPNNQLEYDSFFRKFGTHVITSADFGGRYTLTAEYTASQCNVSLQGCGGAAFGSAFATILGIPPSGSSSSCGKMEMYQAVQSSSFRAQVMGGSSITQTQLSIYTDELQLSSQAAVDTASFQVTAAKFDDWKRSLKCNPRMVGMGLEFIGDFIRNTHPACTAADSRKDICPTQLEWNTAIQNYMRSKEAKEVAFPQPDCGGGGGGGGVSCFSDNNTVLAQSGHEMLVGDVQVGDRLSTTVEDDEVWWVHKSSGQHKLLRVQLQDSHIDLTPHHMIRGANGFRPANEVRVGDFVHTPQRKEALSEVLAITHLSGSVSAPITMSGSIVVNGVEASCYAFGSHQGLHQLLAPFRVLYKLCPWLVQMLSPIGLGMMQALSMVLPIEHNLTSMLAVSTIVALSSPVLAYWTARKLKYYCEQY